MKKVVKLISLLLATMVFVTGCKSDTDVKSNEVKTSKTETVEPEEAAAEDETDAE